MLAQQTVTIKQEKISEKLSCSQNSDVVDLGTLIGEVIELSDSEDADSSFVRSLEQSNAEVNPFLRKIDEGTQPEDEVSVPAETMSENTLVQLREFEGVAVRQLEADEVFRRNNPLQEKPVNALHPNVSGRPKRKGTSRPCPLSKKPPKKGGLEYMDDSSESPTLNTAGNRSDELRNVLNDDFSVFLSSQLDNLVPMPVVEQSKSPVPFTFTKTSIVSTETPSERSGFVANINRVEYEKNVKLELHLNIPQFNLYQVVVHGDAIKTILNLTDEKFNILMSLLNLLERYEFVSNGLSHRPVKSPSENEACRHLDRFFASQSNFTTFNINIFESLNNQFNPEPASISASSVDVTGAIEPSTLSKIKSLRPRR